MLFLNDADVTHIFKDKGKLNTIMKNRQIAHVPFLFFFEIQNLLVRIAMISELPVIVENQRKKQCGQIRLS